MPSTWVLIALVLLALFRSRGAAFSSGARLMRSPAARSLSGPDGVGHREQRGEDLLGDVVDRSGRGAYGGDVVAEERCLLGEAPEGAVGAVAGLGRVALQLGDGLLGLGRVAVEHLLAGLAHQRPAGLELMLGGQAGGREPGRGGQHGDQQDRDREQRPPPSYLAWFF